MDNGTEFLERPAENNIADAEWDLLVKLAAADRLIDYYGWTEQIYGHLTARFPDPRTTS